MDQKIKSIFSLPLLNFFPDQEFGIEVQSGIPGSSYGPHPVRVYIVRGEKKDLLIRTPVFNDGQNLTAKNAEVTFEDEAVLVCLKGSVQADKLIRFNPETKDYSVKDGACEPTVEAES